MNDFQTLFSRRLFVLAGFKAVLTCSLIARLYYLQILKGSHYKVLSDKNHLQSNLMEPSRGLILDNAGHILAGHKSSYRVYLAPELTKFPLELLDQIAHLLAIPLDETLNLKARFKKNRRAKHLIREDLSWDELSKLEIHSVELKGMTLEKGEKRYYPYPEATAHIIGYVSAVTAKEQNSDDPLLYLPGFRTGKSGLEKTQNAILQGEAGIRQVAVDAYGRIAQTLEVIDSTKGKDITLTLNLALQQEVMHILSAHESAGAIVMDNQTGAIRALVSHPSFDAQLFTNNISRDDWKTIDSNPFKPMLNKVTQGLYSPGSLFKMMVALAGLHEQYITSSSTAFCSGVHELNGNYFHCWNWKNGGHGTVTVQSAIAQSCDVFFYQLAMKLGIDKIAATAKAFGFGQLTGIDLPGEKAGLMPTKAWKRLNRRQNWTMGDTLNASIGQGFILSSPLQHAKMVALLTNGLQAITPHFVKNDTCCDHSRTAPLPYAPEHIKLILAGMTDVVNASHGTAYKSRIIDPTFSMAGKTASTQVSRITMQQRKEGTHNDRAYLQREHAMFVAFAPVENPRFVVSVIVEHGGGGARVAAPIARDIALAAHKLGI